MGNSKSQPTNQGNGDESESIEYNKNFDNFYEIIDYIATYYILTMDFKSLTKLTEKEYCDELVILTSDIVNKYFNDLEINYLGQRIQNGVEVNEMKDETIQFVNKDQIENLDVKNDKQKSVRKKRVCIGIAKFYIKIAHLFAAIVMTINPTYIYKDSYGNVVKANLYEKDKIPKNTDRKIYKLNICDNRINSLSNYKDADNVDKSDTVSLQPNVCSINTNSTTNEVKTLSDEPGISELMQLYLDDNYDYSTGIFTGMSDNTKKQFKKDLQLFYTTFTGKKDMPPEIQKFSDIKLKDYNKTNACVGDNPKFKKSYNVSKKDKLFMQYANNINNMMKNAEENHSGLLSIINQLFSFVVDPYSKKKKVRVNPKLTENALQGIVDQTRNIIVKLYVTCERDYIEGIKIYVISMIMVFKREHSLFLNTLFCIG